MNRDAKTLPIFLTLSGTALSCVALVLFLLDGSGWVFFLTIPPILIIAWAGILNGRRPHERDREGDR